MGDLFEFVPLDESHLAEVVKIYNYYIINSTATFHTKVQTVEEMKPILYFDHEKYKTYVIIQDGLICGYCILSPYHKREAFSATAMITLYLSKDFTGRGLGGIALDYLETQAIDHNIHVLICSICSENDASMKLCEKKGYEKSGYFKEVGVKFGRILDVVFYQKIISSSDKVLAAAALSKEAFIRVSRAAESSGLDTEVETSPPGSHAF